MNTQNEHPTPKEVLDFLMSSKKIRNTTAEIPPEVIDAHQRFFEKLKLVTSEAHAIGTQIVLTMNKITELRAQTELYEEQLKSLQKQQDSVNGKKNVITTETRAFTVGRCDRCLMEGGHPKGMDCPTPEGTVYGFNEHLTERQILVANYPEFLQSENGRIFLEALRQSRDCRVAMETAQRNTQNLMAKEDGTQAGEIAQAKKASANAYQRIEDIGGLLPKYLEDAFLDYLDVEIELTTDSTPKRQRTMTD